MYQWDAGNLNKLASHNVSREEAVEAFENSSLELDTQVEEGEFRYPVIGETDGGRVLVVIWTDRGDLIRIVNAFEASPSQVRRFRNAQ